MYKELISQNILKNHKKWKLSENNTIKAKQCYSYNDAISTSKCTYINAQKKLTRMLTT